MVQCSMLVRVLVTVATIDAEHAKTILIVSSTRLCGWKDAPCGRLL